VYFYGDVVVNIFSNLHNFVRVDVIFWVEEHWQLSCDTISSFSEDYVFPFPFPEYDDRKSPLGRFSKL
jgi:uncharacterized protein YrrD